MTEHVRISGPKGGDQYRREQRLYESTELQRIFETVGLSVISLSASPRGTPFDPATSAAMWIVSARR
jgi:hypothetical protein